MNNKLNMEDLLSQITAEETLPVGGGLSPDQLSRVENKVYSALQDEPGFSKTEKITPIRTRKRHKKKMFVVLAAAIIAAFGITAGATQGVWNFDLVGFSGISTKNIDALDGSQSEIGASTTVTLMDYSQNPDGEARDVTFTITDSFGDSQQQFLEITTDYPVPADFDPEKDVIAPLGNYVTASVGADDNGGGGSGDCEVVVRDGMLVFRIAIREDSKSINNADMTLHVEDLYICKDVPVYNEELFAQPYYDGVVLLGGSWELNWTNSYEVNECVYTSDQIVELGGVEVVVDTVTISSLGLRWNGHATKDVLEEAEMDAITAALTADWVHGEEETIIITCNDGTTLDVEHGAGVGVRSNGEVEYYVSVKIADAVLEPENVESITIENIQINIQ